MSWLMGNWFTDRPLPIYALAEYYMATGDERGIEYAEKTFDALKNMQQTLSTAAILRTSKRTGHWKVPEFMEET